MLSVSQKNLGGIPLLSLRLENLSSAPGSPFGAGHVYYDTTLGAFRWYNGSVWKNPLARGDHTGSQTASTISDFSTTTLAFRLDQFATPTAAVAFGSQKITGLADPTNPQEGATKNYVDITFANALAGIDAKASVRIASTGNLGLTGLSAIDGVTPVAGDRVLAKDQTTGSANGVYIAAAGTWARATDADATGEITPGAEWYVEEGTTNGGSKFRVTNTGTITLGTTSITIVLTGGGTTYSAGNGLQLTSTTFSAKVVSSGGILSAAGGLSIDPTVGVLKFAANIGDGSSTSIVVTHNLNTRDITCSVRDATSNAMVECDWTATSVNTATFTFANPPTTNQFRAVIHG